MSALAGSPQAPRQINKGLWLGLLGTVIFSVTLPMTRLAVGSVEAPQMSGVFIAAGRAVVAAALSAVLLLVTRAPLPRQADWWPLALTAGGVVFGFPFLTSIAMRYVEAMHASVIVGVLPLATAAVGALLHRQRPSAGFWACATLGSALVVAFALLKSGGEGGAGGVWLRPADLLLLAAMLCAAVGYGYGAADPATGLCQLAASAAKGYGLVGLYVRRRVFNVAGLFCLVPRSGIGRYGSGESGATGAAVFVDAVCSAAPRRTAGCGDGGLWTGGDCDRFCRQEDAGRSSKMKALIQRCCARGCTDLL